MMPTCLVIAAIVTCSALGPRPSPEAAAQILVANVSSGVIPVFAPAPESVIVAWTPPVIPSTAPVPWSIQIPLPWPAWSPYASSVGPYGYAGHRPARPRPVVAERARAAVVTRQEAAPVAAVRTRAMLQTLDQARQDRTSGREGGIRAR